MKHTRSCICLLALAPLALACDGAMDLSWFGRNRDRAEPAAMTESLPAAEQLDKSAAVRDTVGSAAYPEGLRGMQVRGYGLVAGLGDKGSRECPEAIRKLLISELEKKYGFGLAHMGLGDLPPERLIDSLDTAVVEISGIIPAAAAKGARFDVYVTGVARSQTVSLAGGRLYTCDLKLYQSIGGGPAQAGQRLATAAGPIFVNPFAHTGDKDPTAVVPATGHVLGGGLVQVDRRLRLRLTTPSYELAYRVMNRINERFGHEPKTADALSPGVIKLNVPREYRDRQADFLGLVMHLYIGRHADVAIERANQLAREIVSPSAPHARIVLAWECLGRTILPVLKGLYTHDRPHVRFYAAHTGLRLGDDLAIDVLIALARDAQSPHHREAIRDLGDSRHMHAATVALKPLLDHADPRIRVAAYEALLDRPLNGIQSIRLGKDNFTLDLIRSTGPGLIRAQASGGRRIAIFGDGLACKPPVFYVHPDRAVYINAYHDDTELTLIRRGRFAPSVSPPIPVPFSVADLVRKLGDDPLPDAEGEIRGLAVGYDQVILILHTLCENGTIPAKFVFDRASITDLYGPLPAQGRPEADL